MEPTCRKHVGPCERWHIYCRIARHVCARCSDRVVIIVLTRLVGLKLIWDQLNVSTRVIFAVALNRNQDLQTVLTQSGVQTRFGTHKQVILPREPRPPRSSNTALTVLDECLGQDMDSWLAVSHMFLCVQLYFWMMCNKSYYVVGS